MKGTALIASILVATFAIATVAAHTSSAPPPQHWTDLRYHASLERHRRARVEKMRAKIASSRHAPTLAQMRTINPAACDKCQIATGLLVDILMNVTSLNQTKPIVNAACTAAFGTDTEKIQICEAVADVAIELGHHVFDEIVGHLHFNVPVLLRPGGGHERAK